jgi:hypothetical protein
MLRQIHRLGLTDVGADAELDIVQAGTPEAEFYRLSIGATAEARVDAGVISPKQAQEAIARLDEPDFLACGFAYIGAWARRPA